MHKDEETLHADGTVESKHVETEDDLIKEEQSRNFIPEPIIEGHTEDADENLDTSASTTPV